MRATIIVPFHRNIMHLRACVAALSQSAPTLEIIIAADGAIGDYESVSRDYAAAIVVVPGPSGPAVARNRAASEAGGDILVFVDADVVAAAGAILGMCELLERQPAIAGVFGAYDHNPSETNFVSQFKNLSHAYMHEVGSRDASTFWAGLGAIRAGAFHSVGGFDERFARPSVEDIDLGHRLVAAGYTLRLDPAFRGTHLKRWTAWDCIVTDVAARGIPWTQLILRCGAWANDLNTSIALRVSVVLAYGVVGALLLLPATLWAGVVAIVLLAVLIGLNADYYRWFVEQRGWVFAIGAVPMHLLQHLCSGLSFVVGTTLHVASAAGFTLPGALSSAEWRAEMRPLRPRRRQPLNP